MLIHDDELPRIQPTALFQCEVIAHVPDEHRSMFIDMCTASTARLAMRWLRGRAHDVATQLEVADAGPLYHWLADNDEHEHALDRLQHGHPYACVATGGLVRYALTATPIYQP